MIWIYLLRQGQGGQGGQEVQEVQAVHQVHHCQEVQEDPVRKSCVYLFHVFINIFHDAVQQNIIHNETHECKLQIYAQLQHVTIQFA